MWRSGFRGFVRWGLRKQRKPKSEDSPDKQDTHRFVVPATNFGANRQNEHDRRKRETCHEDGRFFTNRPACSFVETVGWVGTLLAVGLNLQLQSRRCLWGNNQAGHPIACDNGNPDSTAQPCFRVCHLLRNFIFRLVIASPHPVSSSSILPREHQSSVDVVDLSSNGDRALAEGSSEPPLSSAEASEQLASVMKEYFACLEDLNGAKLLLTNEAEALMSFEKAQALGSARAHYNLGVCYETGRSVNKDLDKAVMHYKAAVLGGHPLATYNLGVLYLKGHGNSNTGQSLLEKASNLGVPQAKTFVAHKYLEEGNFDEAVPLLKEAAAAKDPDALFYLGVCCERGLAVPKDHTAAIKHYSRAARQNHAGALDALAAIQRKAEPRVPVEPVCTREPPEDPPSVKHAHSFGVSEILASSLPSLTSCKQRPTPLHSSCISVHTATG
ncbi:uncharacterized protein [Dermacentor andersoni]|uniref:uncharacterized protein n=1 Tax=Dermacentor andersoni TaxID=34620 RepID=UPI002155D21A|nr:DAP3-binding cell death enhancer 1-like [Dermacentor andersoni]